MIPSVFDPEFQNQSLEAKIVVALERISESFRVLLWQESKETGLSPIQIQILIFLLYHPQEKRKVSYLAKEFNMTKATVSEAIRTLFLKELIQKRIEDNDHRSYTINLTIRGEQITRQMTPYAKSLLKPLTELTQEQKNILLEGLLELVYKLQKTGIIQLQRMCFGCRSYESKPDGFYCTIFKKEFKNTELRVDCPEHEFKK